MKMTSKERVRRTLSGQESDRVPFGLFGTFNHTEERLVKEMGFPNAEELLKHWGVDIWHLFQPLTYTGAKRSYEGHAADFWGVPYESEEQGDSGSLCPLKDIQSVDEVEAYQWPDINDFDTAELEKQLESHSEFCIEGGLWAPIFHNVTWLCGFENTLMNMVIQPEVTKALIRKVTDFWIDYCNKTLETAKGRIDIMENCNDFGSQRGLLMSRDMFLEFFAPEFKRLYDIIHSYDVKVMQHCCGSVSEIFEDFIELGADIMNPIQVSAAGMEPEALAERFGGRVAFYGGIDTQYVLPGGPEEYIREVTQNTLHIFERSQYILAPSQGVEPDIPARHITAMFDCAKNL